MVHNASNTLHEALQLLGGSSFHDAHFRNGFGIKIRGGDFVKYNSDTESTANEVFKITDSETTINNTVKLSNILGNRILKTDVNKNVIGVNTLSLDDMPTTQPTWSTLSISTGLSTPVTFGTTNNSFSPYPPFSYSHVGNKIFLRGEVGKDSGNFSSGTLIATLPSNKTPTYNQVIAMPGISAGNDELVVYGNNYDTGFGTSVSGQIYYFTADTNGTKFVVPANTYFFLD